jgi:hypothetical protein
MRTIRNSNHRAFYASHHNAAADVKTSLRDYTGDLQPGEFLLLGSSGLYAQRSESEAIGDGTVVEFLSRSVCNVVALTIEDPFGTKVLYASDSLEKVMSGSERGTIAPRVPRYTSSDESQKVFYNPGPDPVHVTISWEEMGKGGFLAGVHPGNGVLTLELGEIDPAAEGFPLFFRVRPGRKFRIDGDVRLYTTQAPGGGALTLEKADGTVLTATPEELDLLPEAELHHMHLVDGATSRTVPADGWLDIVITSAGSGAPGNLTVEFDYTLL